jgi:hypothetical protein
MTNADWVLVGYIRYAKALHISSEDNDNVSLITQQYDNHDQLKEHRGSLGLSPGQVMVEFMVDRVALGRVFSEYLGFPGQFSFHQLLHIHHLSSGAGTIGQIVADVPGGLSFTPPQQTKKIKILKNTVVDSTTHSAMPKHLNYEVSPQMLPVEYIMTGAGKAVKAELLSDRKLRIQNSRTPKKKR